MVIPEEDKKPSSSDYRAAKTKIKGDDLQVCQLPACLPVKGDTGSHVQSVLYTDCMSRPQQVAANDNGCDTL
jgi:hypothetical protein